MNLKKIQTLILGLILAALLSVEGQAMERWLQQAFSVKLGTPITLEHTHTLLQNKALEWEIMQLKNEGFEITPGEFIAARIKDPATPFKDLIAHQKVSKQFTQLGMITPNAHQTTAGRHLFKVNRKNFTSEDLIATVYLQTNDGGFGRLRSPVQEPVIDQIEAIKRLIALAIPQFTQEDLEATIHLQTNPGNFLGGAIPSPTVEEIEAAKQLRTNALNFTRADLIHQWQTQITGRVRPRLEQLAAESKRLSIRHFDQRLSYQKDLEAESLIQGTPEVLRENFTRDYNQFKEQALTTQEDLLAGLAERRRIANRLFR